MRPYQVVTLLVVLGASSCAKEKLVAALCRADDDCEAGFLCENRELRVRAARGEVV
jgi:hypothetical protein